MRQSGIDVIGEVPWGWHMCQFYRSREDLVDTLVPYFLAGLENNELCVWVTADPLPVEDAKAVLRAVVPDLDRYLQSGQLEILDYSQWYVKSGSFDAGAVVRAWEEKEAQALKNGFAGLRANGNMSWLEKEKWKELVDYERTVNEHVSAHTMLAVCSYRLDQCSAKQVIEIFSNHRLALIRDEEKWRVLESGERKILESSLRESQQRYNILFESTVNPSFVVDMEGRYLDCNQAALEFMECSREELLAKFVQDFAPPGKKEQVFVEHKVLWVKEGATTLETEYCIKGKSKIMELTVAPFSWKGIRSILECGKEITVRKAALAKLTGELSKFKVLYDLAVNMSAEKPLDNNLSFIVEKCRELFNAETAFIALFDDEYTEAKMYVLSGIRTEEFKQMRLPYGKGLGGLVMKTRAGYIVEDYFNDSGITPIVNPVVAREGVVSGMAVPIQSGEKNFGVLYVFNRVKMRFSEDDLAALTLLGNLAAIEIMNKRSRDALRESGRRMSAIIDFLPDATFVIDKEGMVIAWNRATEQITGVKAADIIGKGGYEHGKAFYGQPRPVLVDLVFKSDQELESKYPFLKREGETLFGENFVPACWGGKGAYLWGTASLLRDTNGNIAGAIESIRDITERKAVEKTLNTQLIFLQTLLDTIPSPIFYKDREGRYTGCNRAFEDFLGSKKEDLIGRTVYDLSPKDIADKYFEKDNELFCNPGEQRYEWKVKSRATGVVKDVIFNKATFVDLSGNIVGLIGVISDITERKRAEEENLFKARIIESAIDSIFVYDLDGTVMFVNQAAATSRRYVCEELIGVNMRQLGIHEFSPYPQQHKNELMEKGKVIFESVHFRKDGSQIPVEIHAQLIELRGQKVILAVVRDITERIMADAVQRDSEQKFKSIFDTAGDGILVVDVEDKKILLANKAAALMLGYRGDELISFLVSDLHRNEDIGYVTGQFDGFLKGEISQSLEVPFRRKDGSVLPVDMSAVSIIIGERKCMVGFLRDAAVRRKAEEEFLKSEERFCTLVSNIPGAAYRCACDASWTVEFISDEIERISGYPAADFIGNKIRSYASIMHPEDRQLVEGIILEAVKKKQPYILEYRIVSSQGGIRWVYERGQGVFDARGNLVCLDGAIFDFSERKQMELELREKMRDLEIFHKVAVGRELRLEELKKRVKELESQLQQL